MKLKACIKSMRLRTLPLSLSGTILGAGIASAHLDICRSTFIFLLLTTALLQILSNLSNELGDALHGTDTQERQGIHYSIMDGQMSIPEMKQLIAIIAALCCICGLAMILSAFGIEQIGKCLIFILLGVCTIFAAMRYTLGSNPYGYRGLGDLYVFIFFGLVSTLGAYYICNGSFVYMEQAVLPAMAIGFFSMGVLNVNNIRDMKTDSLTRVTVAIKLGIVRARRYQTVLIILGWACLIANRVVFGGTWWFLLLSPLFALHLKGVWTRKDKELDPMLPLLVMSSFALALIY